MFQKKQRIRNENHRKFVASLPCLSCKGGDSQAAHIRTAANSGTGLKPSDDQILPLCHNCHINLQHQYGQRWFYELHMGRSVADAIDLAKKIYELSGDRDAVLREMIGWKNASY